jgi:hypothetical protein
MAKVTYLWPNGVSGTETRATLESARYLAETIRANGARVGSYVAIVITHRDTGDVPL